MKKIMIIMLNLIISIVVLITSSYAWYTNYFGVNATDGNYLASKSGYYESGDGLTKETAYVISQPRHLYNLAWLQDLGYYDDDPNTTEVETYYFKLKDNIDMSLLKIDNTQTPIPPIGIDGHPFISNFDGNGKTINNLKVDTSLSEFLIKPTDEILSQSTNTITDVNSISNSSIKTTATGMFGVVKTKNKDEANPLSVSKFIINNVSITNGCGSKVGLVCGSVQGNLKQIGVGYSSLASSVAITSEYSLVGEIGSDIKDDMSGAGGDLVIDPKNATANFAEANEVNSVPGSNHNAKYIGEFKKTNYSQTSSVYFPSTSYDVNTTSTNLFTEQDTDIYEYNEKKTFTKIPDDYATIYNDHAIKEEGKTVAVARFNMSGDQSNKVTDGNGKEYYNSGIWFKGVSDGTATIFVEGNGNDGYEAFSVYKLNYNGNKLASSVETAFIFQNMQGAKAAAFFKFNVERGAEYFIGSTSFTSYSYTDSANQTKTISFTIRPKFVYFILPVSNTGFVAGISNIEFVDVAAMVVPGTTAAEPFRVFAEISGNGTIMFARKKNGTDDILYYYIEGSVTIVSSSGTRTTNKNDVIPPS